MEQKKLEMGTLFDGVWLFIKEQFRKLDTWAMLSFLSYLGLIGLGIFICLLIGLNVVYFVFNFSAILAFQQNPLIGIGSIALTLSVMYLVYKLLKKTIGIGNILMLNVLAAVENKPLPRFSVRDERLSIWGLLFMYGLVCILGTLFFVIPGIIFLIRFSMSYMIMLDEKCGIKEAMQKSWQLTEGNFWPMFVFIFPMILIGSTIPFLSIIYMFFPLNMWLYGYIYHQLKQL